MKLIRKLEPGERVKMIEIKTVLFLRSAILGYVLIYQFKDGKKLDKLIAKQSEKNKKYSISHFSVELG